MNTKYRNIIISGDIGTGTSTLGKALAEKLGWQFLTTGDFFRGYHIKHNIPLWDKASIPDELDKKIDTKLLEKIKNEREFVIDSHYAGWFSRNIKDIFRILLVCNPKIATERILSREHTHKESPKEIEERRRQLRAKFKKLYSDDNYEDHRFFNLVIDTTRTEIQPTIQKAYEEFLQ